MTFQHITVEEVIEGVAVVTLNRPEKRNALNLTLMEELTAAFEEYQKNSTYRVIIVTGAGEAFCAGLDLYEAADHTLIEKTAQHVTHMLTAIYTSSMVTIAAVQGDAAAGGAGLVMACDCALMARGARIGFPEIRRGLIAAQVSTLLCRQICMRDVRELLLLGELVDSSRALGMGLVNRVVEESELMYQALAMADMVLKGAPEAIKETKNLLTSLDPVPFFDSLEVALSFHHSSRHSEEAKEGIAAFLEKRSPKWEA